MKILKEIVGSSKRNVYQRFYKCLNFCKFSSSMSFLMLQHCVLENSQMNTSTYNILMNINYVNSYKMQKQRFTIEKLKN